MSDHRVNEWLRALASTGNIAPITLGMSRDAVQAFLGEPDDVGGTSHRQTTPMILRYGGVEFHFGPTQDDGLFLIYEELSDGTVALCIRRHDMDVSALNRA